MAYATISAATPALCLQALHSWIIGTGTNDLGWTLHDTITVDEDYVYSFDGGGTRPTMYCRMSLNYRNEDTQNVVNFYDNVVFRMYRSWNSTAHTGTGETGRIGPRAWMVSKTVRSIGGGTLATWVPYKRIYSTVLPEYADDAKGAWWTSDRYGIFSTGGGLILNNNTDMRRYEHSTRAYGSVIATLPGATLGGVLVADKATGKEFFYCIKVSGAAGTVWFKVDCLAGTFTQLLDPPNISATATSMYYPRYCWDGADTIYLVQANVANSTWFFSKYSIVGNTWTVLTPPVYSGSNGNFNVGAAHGVTRLMYVPASLSGADQDYIYTGGCYQSTPPAAFMQRYRVTDGAWDLSPLAGGGLPTGPAGYNSYTSGACLFYDRFQGTGGRLYLRINIGNSGNCRYLFYIDLNPAAPPTAWVAASSFTPVNDLWTTDDTQGWCQWETWEAGQFTLPTADATLQIQCSGDEFHFKVVAAWTPSGSTVQCCKFAYAGFYDEYYKTDLFTLNGSISPGTNVVINTNESISGKLLYGDSIELYDHNASVQMQKQGQAQVSGGGEVCQIIATGASSVTVASVANAYASGCYLGQDIAGCGVMNDGFAFACVRGERGYQADGDSDHYWAVPLQPVLRGNLVGKKIIGQASPYQLYMNNPSKGSYGCPGELRGIYTANPYAITGDITPMGANNYFTFDPNLKSEQSFDRRMLMMGPVAP